MENIVTITLLTLTLFGNIEMKTFEIPNTRENYYDLGWKKSNSLVCSSWYHTVSYTHLTLPTIYSV